MEYRVLGRTGLRVSLVGLGTGGASQLGQQTGQSSSQSERVVRTALDLGINLFDTSPAYSDSESLLGAGLAGVPRDQYILATKYPTHHDSVLAGPDDFTARLENSLRALRTDCIDVLQYHGVRPEQYQEVINRIHPHALKAQEQGKVRYLGITESVTWDGTHRMLEQALTDYLFDSVMIKYGILNQTAELEALPMCQNRDVGVMVMAAVRTSLRTPSEAVRQISAFIDEGLLDIPRPTVNDPLGLGRCDGVIPSQTRAAYQYVAANPTVSTVLVGTGNPEHLKTNVADILAPPLSEAQIAYLQSTYGTLAWTK